MNINKDVLDELRKMTLLTGKLSELHIKNMQVYPFAFFDGVKSVEIQYNIETMESAVKDRSYIEFHLNCKTKKINHLNKRLEAIEKSIHALLWSDIEVSVFINGTKQKAKNVRK